MLTKSLKKFKEWLLGLAHRMTSKTIKTDPNKAATGAILEGRSPNDWFQWPLHIQEAEE